MAVYATPDLAEIDRAVVSAVEALVGREGSNGIAVIAHPGDFAELGDEGRPAEILVGFIALATEDIDEVDPLKSGETKTSRQYTVQFSMQARFYNYVDYRNSLKLLSALLPLDGYRVPVQGAKPLLFEGLAYESNEQGYWNYTGLLTLVITQQIALVLTEDELKEYRLIHDIPFELGLFVAPVKDGPPDFLDPDTVLDTTIALPPTS